MRLLALDQGTTSTRLLAVEGGSCRMIGQLGHAMTYPAPGWVEQDPAEILANCRSLIEAAGPAAALGLANQGESCLAWDRVSGEPLSPILVWQDCRTLADLARLEADGHGETVKRCAGLPLDPYFSAAKLGWLLREVPEVAAAHRAGRLCLGTTDAFLLHRLTGHFATDRATASRTSLMNLTTGAWDAELCALFGVPMDTLPEIRSNIAGFGGIGRLPVAAAIVDQQGALYGHGCHRRGEAKITFGTGAFALAVSGTGRPEPEGGILPTVAWDLGVGLVYALEGGVQDAGSAVEWALRAGLAEGIADFDDFPRGAAIDRGLVFLPLFSGLGAPHWDRSAAPMMIGMTPDMTRRDLCQALLEGIALQTAELVETLARSLPLKGTISVDGGLTGSRYFTGFLAEVMQRVVVVPDVGERTALGVAALVGLALGERVDLPSGSRHVLPAPCPAARGNLYRAALGRARDWR